MSPQVNPGPPDHADQSRYSRPGKHGSLLTDALAHEKNLVERVSELARNTVVHYRGSGETLPEATAGDIQLRWLEDILQTDQRRHHSPLTVPRPITERVQGCCRDHTLFCVGALRLLGVPARSRVGFATYFSPSWNHDHVIVEAWLEDRWVRFDPEVESPLDRLPTPTDIPAGAGASFLTAAQVWLGHRTGALDVTRFGTFEGSPIAGDWFVFNYVVDEVAHRFGDELLLWDLWGTKTRDLSLVAPAGLDLIDRVARLLLAADSGDRAAERELLQLYRQDPRLHPGESVIQLDPGGGPETTVPLKRG